VGHEGGVTEVWHPAPVLQRYIAVRVLDDHGLTNAGDVSLAGLEYRRM
jgi:hypothetical protein